MWNIFTLPLDAKAVKEPIKEESGREAIARLMKEFHGATVEIKSPQDAEKAGRLSAMGLMGKDFEEVFYSDLPTH